MSLKECTRLPHHFPTCQPGASFCETKTLTTLWPSGSALLGRVLQIWNIQLMGWISLRNGSTELSIVLVCLSIVVLIFWFKLESCRFGSGLGLYQGLPQYLNLRMITNRILGSEAFVHTSDDDVLGGHSNKNVQPQNMQPLQIWISSAVTSWMNTSEWPVRLVSEPWVYLIQFNLFSIHVIKNLL